MKKKDVTDRFFKRDGSHKRGKDQYLRKVLEQVLKANDLDKGIRKNLVFSNWEEIVGEKIAEHALPDRIDGDTLYIKVTNPAWKTELNMMYQTLNQRIQRYTKFEIKKIRIV